MPKPMGLYKIYGGKHYIAKTINSVLDRYPHNIFIDGFFGGGNILFNRKKVSKEIVCDLNEPLINLYKVVRDHPYEFYLTMDKIHYCREIFEWSKCNYDTDSDMTRAVKLLCRNRMSFSGLNEHYSWSNRLRGGIPENVNSFQNMIKRISTASERLQNVDIRNENTMDFFDNNRSLLDNPKCLCYLDPTYLPGTRETPDVYEHEMTRDDHIRLLKQVQNAKAGIVISGYASDLYQEYLDKWVRVEYNVKINMSKKKDGKMSDRVEVLWSNF